MATVEPTEHAAIASSDAEPTKSSSIADSGSKTEPPPLAKIAKRSRAKVLAAVFVPALLIIGGAFLYQAQMNARSPATERSASSTEATVQAPSAPAPEPPPPPTAAAEPPPSASAPKKPAASAGATKVAPVLSADPSKTGILDTTPLPPGRRIVVDGQVVGSSPRRVVVRCGRRRIQIGDLPAETLELPCGGEITFTD